VNGRGWVIAAGAAVVAAGAGVAGVAAVGGDERPADEETIESAVDRTTVEIVRRDLARVEELDGVVGHGESSPLVLSADGTLTAVPAAGDVIRPGGVVAEVDGLPIVAVQGAFPLWRTLGPGVDDGKDVLQVEYLLASLGYAQEYDVTVDEDWTSATTDAVEAFQEDHGQDDDGEIDLGELLFIDGPMLVTEVTGVPGQAAAEAGISVTAPEQSVQVDLDTSDADLLAVDDQVDVELPTGETTTATVTTIGAAQTDESTGTSTLPVTLTLADASSLADGTPVDVHVEIAAATDVLAVPVEAVLALAEGGYAVEVIDPATGTTRLVGVDLGVFADGMVEITGDLDAGAEVVVPE
jgi:peptidoglycan hydrolase-like protein with peptidoglycan-binding domain